MADQQARFEFRIWGDNLNDLRALLDKMAQPSAPRESIETYILSRLTDTANVKIRDALLDIKLLMAQQGQLERWRPALKAGFPLEARAIVETILPALEIAPPALAKTAYTRDELIREVVATNRNLAAANVSKQRYGYKLANCSAEFAILKIEGGAVSETIQVEAEDPAAADSVIARLGLSAQSNVNYIRHLKAMIGMSAASRD
ncbi:MAG: hypothetical protein Q7S58_10120 [Candidatus Binatus sp.]|uniref:hypothetical protein n=1 Tax=Candidatus Binatus sp. TaxID=2811406 RepID=UPI002715AAB7|nr:hypothetical protein [Candidatus Binatus sp.]MDO8432748.1 hypothetical protein [Candidatus Binatus sp.]